MKASVALTSIIFFLIMCIYTNSAFSQEAPLTIVINLVASESRSQNPISPANATVDPGTMIIWLNKDSSYHQIVSGTPDQGP
jgi:plastocyanin